MAAKRLPDYVTRVADNLPDETLSQVLLLTAALLEADRILIAKLSPASAGEVDAVYKPFVRELAKRAIELETMPPSRASA